MTKYTPAPSGNFVSPLPSNPNLEKQKNLAKSLVKSYCEGETEAKERIEALYPNPPEPKKFKLSDAQLVIARGYGFASWSKLKHKINSLTKSPIDLFMAAIKTGDIEETSNLLNKHKNLQKNINDPAFEFGSTAIIKSRTNLLLVDLLLEHGADLNIKSNWSMGPFGILEQVTPKQAQPLIERGAKIDIWAASHLGFLDKVKKLINDNPALINAKGGDGKRPLHYARTIEIAKFLLSNGAEIDATCDDHESTAAQYNLVDNPNLSRYLIKQGCKTDLLMACALNNPELVEYHINKNPDMLNMRVDETWFPKSNKNSGGSIYQWVLGFNATPLQIARSFNAVDAIDVLHRHTTTAQKLLDALWASELDTADDLLTKNKKLIENFDQNTLSQVTDATCNNKTHIAINMLQRGFPANIPGRLGGNVLHWAGHLGNADILKAALETNPPLNDRDENFDGLPTGWVIVGYENNTDPTNLKHAECLKLLLEAGAECDDWFPTGHDEIDEVFREFYYS